ncbi:MAG: shikimate kinase [Planctomycetota bacterium]
MADAKTSTREPLLEELGLRLRRLRDAQGLTLSELAERGRLSRRYLTELEAGRANPSLLKLARLAQVLRIPLGRLCDLTLPAAGSRRIALVGLRGAGKSTVGRALALALETSFRELDEVVEELAGLDLAAIFALHGEGYYRRLEREALELQLSRAGEGVLAAGGSIVTHPETWERLRETCFVVWLRARPEDHWSRVVAQGDLRPMNSRPRAMEELEAILAARAPLYAQADLVVDTSRLDPAAAAAQIAAAVEAP